LEDEEFAAELEEADLEIFSPSLQQYMEELKQVQEGES